MRPTKGLKIPWPQGCAGSSPAPGTTLRQFGAALIRPFWACSSPASRNRAYLTFLLDTNPGGLTPHQGKSVQGDKVLLTVRMHPVFRRKPFANAAPTIPMTMLQHPEWFSRMGHQRDPFEFSMKFANTFPQVLEPIASIEITGPTVL